MFSYFLLPTSYFPLPTSFFLLPTSFFLLPTSDMLKFQKKDKKLCMFFLIIFLLIFSMGVFGWTFHSTENGVEPKNGSWWDLAQNNQCSQVFRKINLITCLLRGNILEILLMIVLEVPELNLLYRRRLFRGGDGWWILELVSRYLALGLLF